MNSDFHKANAGKNWAGSPLSSFPPNALALNSVARSWTGDPVRPMNPKSEVSSAIIPLPRKRFGSRDVNVRGLFIAAPEKNGDRLVSASGFDGRQGFARRPG
jgi:hypothetical protein